MLTRLEYARRATRGSEGRRVIAILGMHRSGTSAVAGTLQAAGLYLGPVLRKHESNRKGTRENLAIVQLHDEILAHSGGSWREPPTAVRWNDAHRKRRDRIIESFDGAEVWGFKDPRTLFLLEFWREALGESLECVGVFREPSAVVASLLRRDGGTSAEWWALWTRYNDELLGAHGKKRFPLVEFGPSVEGFHRQMAPVLRALGLREATSFFDPDLPSVSDLGAAPDAALALHERLRAASARAQ